jgi:hypothetical protein
MLKNDVVVKKGGRESSYSWMTENDLKTDAHSSVSNFVWISDYAFVYLYAWLIIFVLCFKIVLNTKESVPDIHSCLKVSLAGKWLYMF